MEDLNGWIVYSFGNIDVLWRTFNAISMICAQNSTYFTSVSKFALTVGGLWAACRAIFKGNIGIFATQWFFPTFFLFVFMFVPKTTVWLKDEVANQQYKVDNIPAGIAIITSVSTSLSHALAERIETYFRTADPVNPVSDFPPGQSSIMFGAKVVGKIKEIQIQNPNTLNNTKEFLRQCFLKPYIIGDLQGKKSLALSSENILQFIEENMPNNFGIYYKGPNGTDRAVFKLCKDALPLIKASIAGETNDGLIGKFSVAIGMQNDTKIAERLKAITSDTLSFLRADQQDLNEWMQQAMLLNANREALDDWREKLSMNRLYPELISMHATRGMFQQSFSYLVGGKMAEDFLAIMQSVAFSLIISCMVVVLPLTCLVGGFKFFQFWCNFTIWVSSWPIFYSLVHCLGMLSLSGKVSVFGGNGMSILSQGSYSEYALNTYATYQMLGCLVPPLSWALFKACSHGMSILAGQFSPLSVASSVAAGIADNNLSMDNVSIGNRTISQQNLAPSLMMGDGIMDDGGMRVTTTDDGRQFITESVDTLSTNFRASDLLQSSLSDQYAATSSRLNSLSSKDSMLRTMSGQQALELASRLTAEEARSIGISEQEQLSFRDALSTGNKLNDSISTKDGKDTTTSNDANIGFNVPGFGGASARVSASNSSGNSHEESIARERAINNVLEKTKLAAKEGRFNSSNSDTQSLARTLSQNYQEQESIGREISDAISAQDQLSRSRQYVAQNAATIDRNMNEPVLNAIIDSNIPGVSSKEQAARWARTHIHEAASIANSVMPVDNIALESGRHLSGISPAVQNMTMRSEQHLKNEYQTQTSKIEASADKINNKQELAYQSVEERLNNNLSNSEKENYNNLNNTAQLVEQKGKKIEDQYDDASDSTVKRTLDEIGKNSRL
ncbi:conjugal transfer protein TraG N-terminal domain-containing protein [Rickettsia sp. TH2014]|uniref:conjugal transfer protein TraG N-terminal domain-containing protein n=1 Tax=Rickettsia sp. TH2014 TaxID=1967503 RepID=UPI002114A39F|nr:conjugal transfer protein TraG N-terminal domain-containing protein [Rickettsia sp. TH2014]